MIASASGGSGFGGILGYALSSSKEAEIIGGNVLGSKAASIAREFRAAAKKNSRVQKPVRHISISFAEEDGEIDNATKERIAFDFMVEMGYLLPEGEIPTSKKNNAQYLVVSHGRSDPDHDRTHKHDHIHIIANAVDLSGNLIPNDFNYARQEKAMRKLEIKYGLKRIPCSWEQEKRAPTHGQQQRYMKEKELVEAGKLPIATPPVSDQLQTLIINSTKDQPSLSEFLDRLTKSGVNIRAGVVDIRRTDRATKVVKNTPTIGLSYKYQGVKFQARDLNASVNQLVLRQRVKFDPVRDFPRLSQLESIEQGKSDKSHLQRAINFAATGKPSMTIFAQRLQQMGVQPKFRITNNRQAHIPSDFRVSGVSYEIKGKRWNGSQLSNASWPKLLSVREISYSEDADILSMYEASKGVDLAEGLEKTEIIPKTTEFSSSSAVVAQAPQESLIQSQKTESKAILHSQISTPGLELNINIERDAELPEPHEQEPVAKIPQSAEANVREVIHAESWDSPNLATFFERLESRGVSASTVIRAVSAVSPLGDNFEKREIGFVFEFEGKKFDEVQITNIKTLVQNGRLIDRGQMDFETIAQLPHVSPCKDNQEKLQLMLDLAAAGTPAIQTFVRRLQLLGVRPHFEFDRSALRLGEMDKVVTGISYRLGDYKLTGGQLIDGSWPRLIDRRGIQFNPDQDLSVLRQVNHGYDLSGSVPMIVLSLAQEEYLQDAANHTMRLLRGQNSLESSRVLVSYDGEILLVNRKRPEKTVFTAVLDEDSGQWVAIGPTDINQSDVQLLERQADGRKKPQSPPEPQIEELEIELPLEDRSFSVQLEQGELFRSMDYSVRREIDRSL